MDLLTLQQAIQKLGISDSTMRRYMRKKKLPYQKIEGRYYFHESDINKLLPKQSDTQEAIHEIFMKISNIEQEIETLKQQVSQMPSHLEQRLAKLEAQAQSSSTPQTAQPPPTPHSEPAKPSVPHSDAIAGLPDDLVAFVDFYESHNISESTARRTLDKNKQHVTVGEWRPGGNKVIRQALDVVGRHVFYLAFKEKASFQPCPDCPH